MDLTTARLVGKKQKPHWGFNAMENLRLPRIVSHLFDHPSTTVTFGFWLFIVASFAAFFVASDRKLGADEWLWCVVFSSILIGGVRVGKDLLAAMAVKTGKALPPEEKKDAPPSAQ